MVARSALSMVFVLVACTLSFAILMGQGEATGEVIGSRVSGDHVIFQLNISSQNNEQGPALGSPNYFGYAGPDRMEVTKGDVLKLRYNSDDSYGIHVESIEFIENKPGTVEQGYGTAGILIPIVAAVAAGLLILIWLIRRRTPVGRAA